MCKGEVDECLSASQYRFKEREGMKLMDGACITEAASAAEYSEVRFRAPSPSGRMGDAAL